MWGASKATFLHCFQTDPLPVLNLGIEMKLRNSHLTSTCFGTGNVFSGTYPETEETSEK